MTKHAAAQTLVSRTSDFLSRYMTFPTQDIAVVCSLYAMATHIWPHFDAFPYMHITATTKRAGKTRLSELLSFVVSNPVNFAGATAATIFRIIRDQQPTIILDEIEALVSEAATVMRSVLNVGYRRGQTVPRVEKGQVVHFQAYCPKIFIGIGDVYDTLRDRSIIVRLARGEAPQRYVYEIAKGEGEELANDIHDFMDEYRNKIMDWYVRTDGLKFLSDRDEEIWLPLFATCSVAAPDLMNELSRIAVDLCTEKTAPIRRYVDIADSEDKAMDDEFAIRLLDDVKEVFRTTKRKAISSAEMLEALYNIPTAPWRKFKGVGLTVMDLANLLSRFGVKSKNIKVPGSNKYNKVDGKVPPSAIRGKVVRGYSGEDVARAKA